MTFITQITVVYHFYPTGAQAEVVVPPTSTATTAFIFVAMVLTVFIMVMLALLFGAITFDGLSAAVVTLGLFILSGLGLLLGFTVAYFARIIVALACGRFIFTRFNSRLSENGYWSMILGVLLIAVLGAIPYNHIRIYGAKS